MNNLPSRYMIVTQAMCRPHDLLFESGAPTTALSPRRVGAQLLMLLFQC